MSDHFGTLGIKGLNHLLNWFVAKVKICIPEDSTGSSPPEVFLGKGILKIYSKFTGEHPCQSVISIKLQSSFIEIALRHGYYPINLLHIFRTPFPKNTSAGGMLLQHVIVNESLVLYSTRLHFKQYIRTNQAHFCIELCKLTAVDGITLQFRIYYGKKIFYDVNENVYISTIKWIPVLLMEPFLNDGPALPVRTWSSFMWYNNSMP